MKRILVSVIITAFFEIIPFVSFARTIISDNELDAVTAQEGITIDYGATLSEGIDVYNFAPSLVSFGDESGFTGYTSAGYFGMKDISIGTADSYIHVGDLMTIDVGSSGGMTKLKIGLPRVQAYITDISATVKLDANTDLSDAQSALGTFYATSLISYLNTATGEVSKNGSITISAHPTTEGVSLGFDNVVLGVPRVRTHLSWGDSNGFAGYTSAGYFGMRNLYIGTGALFDISDLITLNGGMDIDVGTSGGSLTALNVVLPTIQLGPLTMSTKLKPDSVNDLSSTRPSLGSLDVNGFSTSVTGSMKMSSH